MPVVLTPPSTDGTPNRTESVKPIGSGRLPGRGEAVSGPFQTYEGAVSGTGNRMADSQLTRPQGRFPPTASVADTARVLGKAVAPIVA